MSTVQQFPGAVYPSQTMSINPGTQLLQAAVSGGLVTMGQFKRSLINSGVEQTISDAIPADVTNVLNMQWNNGLSIYKNDTLYNFVQAKLGYTSVQMGALMSYAAAQQV